MVEKSSQITKAFEKADEKAEYCEYLINGVIARVDKPSDKRKMTLLLNKLKNIPTGRDVLNVLAQDKVPVILTSFMGGYGGFSSEKKHIILNTSYPSTKLCSSLIHEARHYMQHQAGGKDYEKNELDIRSQIMLDRAKEADAQVWAFKACREWVDAGDKEPYLKFAESYCDMHRAFQPALKKSKSLNKALLSDVFKSWYEQEGVMTAYENSYMLRKAQADIMEHIVGSSDIFYSKDNERKTLSEKQVLDITAGSYLIDGEKVLASDACLAIHNFTKQMLSYAFAQNGFADPSLETIPVYPDRKYKEWQMSNAHLTEASFLKHDGLREVAKQLNIPKKDVEALLDLPPDEQKKVLGDNPKTLEEFRKTKLAVKDLERLGNMQLVSKEQIGLSLLNGERLAERQGQIDTLKEAVRNDEIYLLAGCFLEKIRETKPALVQKVLALPGFPDSVRKELNDDHEKLFKLQGKAPEPVTKEDENQLAFLSRAIAARGQNLNAARQTQALLATRQNQR